MVPPEELAASAPFDRLSQVAADVYGAMGPALRAANAMDFDDLLLHPLTLFREHPDRLRAYQQRFSFILVDEFQDTNKAQYQLVRLLGAHGNVCAVGDDDQSIYGWRGADVRNMQDFLKDFPGARLVRLEENYRSTQVVLDAANGVIAENSGRIGKTLTTRRRGGEAVTLLAAADERDEAEWVARELQRRSAAGEWSYARHGGALPDQFAVAGPGGGVPPGGDSVPPDRRDQLLRAARGQGPAGLSPAGRQPEPTTRRSSARSPCPGGDWARPVSRRWDRQAQQWGKPLLATAAMADRITDLRPNVREAFRSFAALIEGAGERAGRLPPAEVLEQIIRTIDYEAVLLAEGPEGADRWENVRELVASAADWSEEVTEDPESGTPLERFLAEAALLSAGDTVVGSDLGVTLMTLHTAKGLEWPVVVLTGMEHGLFPLARAEEQPDGLEEERRLCYVGLTRAKDKLYLTWARARRRGGELRPGIPSRFLKALPPGIVEEKRTTSLWAPDWGGGRAGRRYGGWGAAAAARRCRTAIPPDRPARPIPPSADDRGLPGHAPLRQRRACPAPALRGRHDPGVERHRPGSQGLGQVR